jgi:hypothetical protein
MDRQARDMNAMWKGKMLIGIPPERTISQR